MKKLLATLLAVTTVLSSASMIAYADDEHSAQLNNSDNQTNIIAKYTSVGNNPWGDTRWDDETTNVSVSVTWTDPSFEYEFGTEWIPSEQRYEDAPGWQKDSFTITVTNHSNCPVKASIKSKFILKKSGIGILYNNNNQKTAELTSAVNPEDTAANRNIAEFIPRAVGIPAFYLDDQEEFVNFTISIGANDPIINPEPEEPPATEPETPPAPEPEEDTGHEHHHVFDQFGRIVCSGCGLIIHDICIDEDGDGECDECGMERDFCPDCHASICRCVI